MESVIDFGRRWGNVHSHSHLQNDSLMGLHCWKGLLREVLWESAAAGVLLLTLSMCMRARVCVCFMSCGDCLRIQKTRKWPFSTVKCAFASSILVCLFNGAFGRYRLCGPFECRRGWILKRIYGSNATSVLPSHLFSAPRLSAGEASACVSVCWRWGRGGVWRRQRRWNWGWLQAEEQQRKDYISM